MTSKRVPAHLHELDQTLAKIIDHATTLRASLELIEDLGTRKEVTIRPEHRDRVTGGGRDGYDLLEGDDRAKRLMRDIRRVAADTSNRLGALVAAWGHITDGPPPADTNDRLPPAEHRALKAASERRAGRVEEVNVDW